ncbi:hypothetical protein I7I50_08603 [Histoplasma capsulatum G186AR]|uniref:Uncharacterized protein n=1 Tax=Ajellomyces capsulatus TaxID=5037 RepID=A0A8H7YT84_AJECA|nr:hypothetical protein I7I52_06118 [Histoplasma capsulatum]QSS73718.1 hypothetical protein I7I50_08603 [Histoplasma capsulatum G186AR]
MMKSCVYHMKHRIELKVLSKGDIWSLLAVLFGRGSDCRPWSPRFQHAIFKCNRDGGWLELFEAKGMMIWRAQIFEIGCELV